MMTEFLKCDAAGCDHRETVDAITPDLIGKPCPLCGANLLTQGDYDQWATAVRPVFDLLKKLGLTSTDATPKDGHVPMRVGLHDGKLTTEVQYPTRATAPASPTSEGDET